MKSIIEREATFENNFRHGGQSNTKTIIMSICKGNTMKQDMLNSQIHYKRHILVLNHVFWAITRQNPFRNAVCSLIDETRRNRIQNKEQEAVYFTHMGTPSSNWSQQNVAILFISPTQDLKKYLCFRKSCVPV